MSAPYIATIVAGQYPCGGVGRPPAGRYNPSNLQAGKPADIGPRQNTH